MFLNSLRSCRMFKNLLFLFGVVRGIYFYVPTGGSDKCFGEEAYPDAVIHVSYEHMDQHGVFCTLSFLDEKELVLLQKPLTDPRGSVATLVPANSAGGTFKVCIKCPGSRWTANEPQKFQIKIDVGGRSLLDSGDAFAKVEDVRNIEAKAKTAMDRILDLHSDNEYERVSESIWREKSEKTNSAVLWLHVLGIAIIAIVAIVQSVSLKRYFKREKLIF